jgi:6-phosphofructokinase
VGLARKRIGILTGGGDVSGLNAVIKSVAAVRTTSRSSVSAVVGRPSRT